MSYEIQERRRKLRAKFGWNEYAPIATANKRSKLAPIVYNPQWSKNGNRDKRRWIENASNGLRVKTAKEILRETSYRNDAGCEWYVDSFLDDTTVPHVIFLPSRAGQIQAFAATSDPWNADAFLVDVETIHDSANEAARSAESLSECYSESCREYDAQQRAESDIEQALEEIREARESHSALAVEYGATRDKLSPAILESCRDSMRHYRRKVAKLRKVIQERRENPWSAVERY